MKPGDIPKGRWICLHHGTALVLNELLSPGRLRALPYADALVNSAEGLKDKQASVFNEVLEARHQEEIIHQHLWEIEQLD